MTSPPGGSETGATGAPDLSGTWTLDPAGSSVRFRSTSLWGLIPVKGEFRTVRGQGAVGGDGSVTGELVIDVESVATGKTKRDTHLRSADFFDGDNHPTITFTASGPARVEGDRATVSGTLTVAGESRPLEVPVELREVDGSGVTLAAAVDIDRAAWGVTWKKMGMTRMSTPVEVVARFIRAAPGGN